MTEPTYEYRKGEGWVATVKPRQQRYALHFYNPRRDELGWRNALFDAHRFTSMESATKELEHSKRVHPNFTYKIVTYDD